MATLTNTQISVTYVGLLKTSGNTILDSTPQQITDGSGNNSQLFLSTAKVGIGATPSGSDTLQVQGSISITGDGSNATTLTESGSGDFTIDVAGDLSLDADGGDILFKDAGTTIGTFSNSSTDFVIQSNVSDKDIIFKGNDDGSTISPLTIDMSESGRALFNTGGENLVATFTSTDSIAEIRVADNSNYSRILNVGTQLKLMPNDGVELLILDGNDNTINVPDSKTLTFGDSDDLQISHNGSNTLITNNTGNILFTQNADDGDIAFYSDDGSGGVAEYFRVDGANEVISFTKQPKLFDNVKLNIGDASDLQIFHGGTDSRIENKTGHLFIRNDADNSDIIFQTDDGAGNVATYFFLDGSRADGTYLYTEFPDNSVIGLGNDTDLQIYHSGTNSLIENFTNDLIIQQKADDSDIVFKSDDGSGGTTEYFRVDGGAEIVVASKEFRFADNVPIKLGTGPDFQMLHNGTTTSFENSTGNLLITNFADDSDIIFKSDDGSGGVTEYFRLDGSSEINIFSKDTFFIDNVNLKVGSSGDLILLHDGSNSFINNVTGNLTIKNSADDSDIIFESDDGSGGVTEYFRLDGGDVRIKIPDNIIMTFGAGGDLQLSHDATDSLIRNYTGDLKITNFADDKDIIFKSDDGSGGTTEYFRFDGSSVQSIISKPFRFLDNVQGIFGTGNDLQIYHDASNSYIQQTGTGDLIIEQTTDDNDIIFKCDDGSGGTTTYLTLDGSLSRLQVDKNMLFVDSKAAFFGNSQDLQIYHDGSNSYITNSTGELLIQDDDTIRLQKSNGENMLRAVADGSVELYENNVKKFETTTSGVAVTGGMTLSGNVEGRKIPFVFRSSFDDSAGSTSIFVIPFDANVETTVSGADEEHIIIAPYAGELTKVQWKHVKGTLDTGFTTELFLYVNGSQQTSSGELTASSDAITWSPTSSNTFSAGDELMIAYQKSATSKDWEHVSVSVVFSFTSYNI